MMRNVLDRMYRGRSQGFKNQGLRFKVGTAGACSLEGLKVGAADSASCSNPVF